MSISVIIPTYNEAANIARLVKYLLESGADNLIEVIVSDSGSEDDTLAIAIEIGASGLISPEKGRASQMNYGASLAKGDILYFVHADTIPPESFAIDILKAVDEGYELGRYRSVYDSNKWPLKINSFLSRFDTFQGMGGDQTLFITRNLFLGLGGFDDSFKIMEEFEFCARARKNKQYKIFKKSALISARKYDNNSWLTIQRANFKIVEMYKSGASQESMVKTYKRMLNYR